MEDKKNHLEYRFIEVRGKKIAYVEEGEGIPMVMLHGWPQSSYVWRKVIPLLSQHYRVFAIDLPGLGESQSYDAFSTAEVSAILSDVTQHLGLSSYHLVGHDIGAWVAVTHALQYEEQLRSLTVVDAGIPGLIPDELFKPANASRIWQFYFHAVHDIPEFLIEGKEYAYLSWYFRNKSIVKEAISKSDEAFYVNQYMHQGVMSHGFEYYRAFPKSAEQNLSLIKTLQIPVLAIGGESGVGGSIGVAMHKISNNVTTHVINDCGHYVPEECPEAFTKSVLSFTSEC